MTGGGPSSNGGGAVLLRHAEAASFDARLTLAAEAKQAIGATTASLIAALALLDGTRARVLLPGGQPSLPELALAGPLALASLRSLRFDVAVLGARAFSAGIGITTPDLADAEAKQQLLAVAGRALLAVDGSKWGRRELVRVCPPARAVRAARRRPRHRPRTGSTGRIRCP
ncbi:hypothetical protein ACIRSS_27205 [Amycolatopsis sp. NPDC101161]|uniref:hypothetical protein n=1 Tax=Amycolatopsis sp. NPDC101161 TaxID=3363940 RepID=UPI00380E1DB1